MSYKGRDLDLRTPYASGASEEAGAQAGWSMPAVSGREGTIPVDQTALACCNAAYDAALFHGAREVRVEHLLYALTRVDPARDILEQHGIRTQQLRRDAAAAIVDELPAAGGSKAPRSSTEFENLLRRAAGRAALVHAPASVHDLLRAVLHPGRDAPATALLLRSAGDPQQLERWAAESAHVPAFAAVSLQPAIAQELIGRLESVETAMRTLATEVAADRRAMLDLMGEIQHELRAARQDSIAAQPAIVLDKIEDVGRSVTGLSERFERIGTLAPGDGANVLASRLAALESRLSEQPSAIADAVAYMLTERHRDGPLQLSAGEGATGRGASERLAELETLLRGQAERMDNVGKAHERDLNEIFEALVKLGNNQQTLAGNLEAWRLDSSGDVSIVSNRLESMERTLQEAFTPPTVRIIEESSRFKHEDLENSTGFKRWLYGTGRVLPSSWREDMSALRESLRSQRRIEKS
jgi:hypothetical protein